MLVPEAARNLNAGPCKVPTTSEPNNGTTEPVDIVLASRSNTPDMNSLQIGNARDECLALTGAIKRVQVHLCVKLRSWLVNWIMPQEDDSPLLKHSQERLVILFDEIEIDLSTHLRSTSPLLLEYEMSGAPPC